MAVRAGAEDYELPTFHHSVSPLPQAAVGPSPHWTPKPGCAPLWTVLPESGWQPTPCCATSAESSQGGSSQTSGQKEPHLPIFPAPHPHLTPSPRTEHSMVSWPLPLPEGISGCDPACPSVSLTPTSTHEHVATRGSLAGLMKRNTLVLVT